MFRSLPLVACLAAAAPTQAAPLPEPIRAMLLNALATSDPSVVAAVATTAAKTAPESVEEIEALVASFEPADLDAPPEPIVAPPPAAAQALARAQAPAPMPLVKPPVAPPPWKGSVEVGGALSTGNSETLGVYGAADLTRRDGDWTHKVSGRADYQKNAGEPTTERASLAYQPQLKLNTVFYAYGLGQYEHDRFLGYANRYTAGAGVGVFGIERPDLKITFDAGPALRRTEFYGAGEENTLAGRGAFSLKWAPIPRLTVAQDVAVYVESATASAQSTTAVDTRLFGPLKARFSYNIQYERGAPAGQKEIDTTSRATLVYSF